MAFGKRSPAGIINVIKYDGPENGATWLVYKCPFDKYVLGSQLVVSEGQEAIFFSGGKALDLFGPGTHTLKTGNLPLLNALVNLPFGGQTPFAAEIYYVNTTAAMNLKWGTSTPIPVEDPKYGIILNVGARGQYGLSIEDSRRFVTQLVGAMPGGMIDNQSGIFRYFNGLVNAQVKSVVTEQLAKQGISFLEISQYLPQISEVLYETMRPTFERFGMSLLALFCESIAPKSEEYEKLRQYKEELALGQGFYQQRRSLDIMEKLAENPSSGGMANAGIGLGMGLGAIQQFGNVFAGLGQSVDTQPTAKEKCPSCGQENEKGSKFCSGCGAQLSMKKCPNCNQEVPSASKFCNACGQKLG